MQKKVAILVGGSDLFSGIRGVSKGARIIQQNIASYYDDILLINYNYFLDFGRCLSKLPGYVLDNYADAIICLYGYSKGGEVVLELCRRLKDKKYIDLLITIDIADGPWSGTINRNVPGNVKKNINVYQGRPRFPLLSYGMRAASNEGAFIENINLTNQVLNNHLVTHSNIEMLMVEAVIEWMKNV
ncbi:MAG: hypothetical protein KF862_17890 [Chitinophagaceae bacterium]|nr:hypothetical protein [Chitinophagaceae bacterium]